MIRAIRSIPLERVLRCPRIQCMGFEAMKRRWAGVGWCWYICQYCGCWIEVRHLPCGRMGRRITTMENLT
jgi:hypothetical protein